MADNPDKKDSRDRNRVAGGQDHEVDYFASQHGLSREQVRDLIARFGNDRATLEREARKLKG